MSHPIGCLCRDCLGDHEPESEVLKIKIVDWMYEDEMVEDRMYNALYPLSKVNFVRIFPKTIEVIKDKETRIQIIDELKSILQINAEELLESDMFDNAVERKGAKAFYERLCQRVL